MCKWLEISEVQRSRSKTIDTDENLSHPSVIGRSTWQGEWYEAIGLRHGAVRPSQCRYRTICVDSFDLLQSQPGKMTRESS